MEKHFEIPYLTPCVAQSIYYTSPARKMEVASRLAGRVDVHCHSRMILSIWFSDNMRYIGIAQLEGLRTTISRHLRGKTQIGEKVPESGSEPAALPL